MGSLGKMTYCDIEGFCFQFPEMESYYKETSSPARIFFLHIFLIDMSKYRVYHQ